MAKVYVVKAGDSLSKIAQAVYGDASRWKEIYEANKDKLKNPDQIKPGQELVIPSGEPSADEASALARRAMGERAAEDEFESRLGQKKKGAEEGRRERE